jgi:hypothetical protein
MIIISIDPSIQEGNTGVAIWKVACRKYWKIFSTNSYQVIKVIEEYNEKDIPLGVVVEDGSLDKVSFRRGVSQAATNKMILNAGQNGGAARVIIQACIDLEIPFVRIAPSDRDNAKKTKKHPNSWKMPTKLTSKQFFDRTKWEGSTNEHGRDAATMVWKMSKPNFQYLSSKTKKS